MDPPGPSPRSIPKQPHNEPIADAASTSNTASDSSVVNTTNTSSQGRSNSVTSATQD
ncbi:hypothetical protein BGZ74_005353, partial [Mortierella antarctica]